MLRAIRYCSWVGVGLGCVAAAPSAAARDLAHTVQLSLDGTLASYETVTASFSGQSVVDGSIGGLGNSTLPAVTSTNSSFSLMGSGFGLGVGYVLNEHVLLGAQLQLAHSSLNASTEMQVQGENSTTSASLLPRVEYIFNGGVARPYFAVLLGVDSTSSKLAGADSASTSTSATTEYRYGCGFGAHAFLNDYFSLDPALTFLGEFGTGHSDVDYSTSGVLLMATVGFSTWIGGQPHPAPSITPDSEPAPEPESEAPLPPLAAQIGLPDHHLLDVQVARDPTLPSILVRLYERQEEAELSNCSDIRVLDPQSPIELNVTSVGDQPLGNHARHFVVGVLPLHGLEVLARTGANIAVCQNEWPLSEKSRAKIQDFLARRVLIGQPPEPVTAAPAPPSPANSPTPPPPETLFPTAPPLPAAPAPSPPPPPATMPAPAPAPLTPKPAAPPPSAPPLAAPPSASPSAPPAAPSAPAKRAPPPSAAFPDTPAPK